MNATSTFRITTPGPFLRLLVHSHLPCWKAFRRGIHCQYSRSDSKTSQRPSRTQHFRNQIWLVYIFQIEFVHLPFTHDLHEIKWSMKGPSSLKFISTYTVISHSYPQRGILSHIFPLPSSAWLVKLDAFWPTSVNMLSPCWPTGRNVMMTTMQWCNGCDHIKTSVF